MSDFDALVSAFLSLCRTDEHLPGEHDQADHGNGGNGGGGNSDKSSSKKQALVKNAKSALDDAESQVLKDESYYKNNPAFQGGKSIPSYTQEQAHAEIDQVIGKYKRGLYGGSAQIVPIEEVKAAINKAASTAGYYSGVAKVFNKTPPEIDVDELIVYASNEIDKHSKLLDSQKQ